jgi:hypothetical protein
MQYYILQTLDYIKISERGILYSTHGTPPRCLGAAFHTSEVATRQIPWYGTSNTATYQTSASNKCIFRNKQHYFKGLKSYSGKYAFPKLVNHLDLLWPRK